MTTKSRTKKKTTWILLLALAFSGLIAGGIWYYINKSNHVKSELADFILANPESAAVVAYTFNEKGEFVADEHALFYNADNSFIMASTMKIIVLAAYADAVANGELDPNERVVVTDWELYYLPMTDGDAHLMGLKSLGIEADNLGFARDRELTASLDDLARLVIHYSENAATDYLIMRLGTEKMATVMQQAGLEHHTSIGLTLGVALAAFSHENPSFSTSPVQRLMAEEPVAQAEYMNRLVELYTSDPRWRADQIGFMTSLSMRNLNSEEVWANQVMFAQLLPRGTAREYAQMMAKVASGNLISAEVSEIMQKKLEKVPSDWPLRLLFFNRFGAKDGVTAGVLTLASYAVPKRGLLSGRSRVIVIMTTQLPPENWAEQVQHQGHYLLPIDLAQATGVFDKLANTGYE